MDDDEFDDSTVADQFGNVVEAWDLEQEELRDAQIARDIVVAREKQNLLDILKEKLEKQARSDDPTPTELEVQYLEALQAKWGGEWFVNKGTLVLFGGECEEGYATTLRLGEFSRGRKTRLFGCIVSTKSAFLPRPVNGWTRWDGKKYPDSKKRS